MERLGKLLGDFMLASVWTGACGTHLSDTRVSYTGPSEERLASQVPGHVTALEYSCKPSRGPDL